MVGFPGSVQDIELEDKVLTIFKKICSGVSPHDIEACHRLKKYNDKVIAKFSWHKDCEQMMCVKNDLKKLKIQEVGLNPYSRMLWLKCKGLHHLGKINNFYISNGTIKTKISENGNSIQ